MYEDALRLCHIYGVCSERAAALMCDIKVQNGSISVTVRARIERDSEAIDAGNPDAGVERLRVIAHRRADAANPQFAVDVRARKLTIANGVGSVHGAHCDLEGDCGITLKPLS